MNLNFSMSELIHSDCAVKNNINNMPDILALDNMLNLVVYCLQPLRDKIAKPIIITSGFRNSLVNSLVGGVNNSQHTKGQAVDIVVDGMKPVEIIEFVKLSGIEFDQLINENNQWVHISFSKGHNRKQILNL